MNDTREAMTAELRRLMLIRDAHAAAMANTPPAMRNPAHLRGMLAKRNELNSLVTMQSARLMRAGYDLMQCLAESRQ